MVQHMHVFWGVLINNWDSIHEHHGRLHVTVMEGSDNGLNSICMV
jgi:hypothetical protein